MAGSQTGNYLRVRGEYGCIWIRKDPTKELPPRARRIPAGSGVDFQQHGTTSACAENTVLQILGTTQQGNYLRVRGEYMPLSRASRMILELPPRARRILDGDTTIPHRRGTTSACAENTVGGIFLLTILGNYLRVRGEYAHDLALLGTTWELPPRARRILGHLMIGGVQFGTTSACAENTVESLGRSKNHRNYLRVRGEYLVYHWYRQ